MVLLLEHSSPHETFLREDPGREFDKLARECFEAVRE
jgi:hypothetical protein